MKKFDEFINTFLTEDYFFIFMANMFIILIVLIIAFIKTRKDYMSLGNVEEKIEVPNIDRDDEEDDILNLVKFSESLEKNLASDDINKSQVMSDIILAEEIKPQEIKVEEDKNEPIIKITKTDNFKLSEQLLSKPPIVVPDIKTYDEIIDEYESSEEENAVISTADLEMKTKERMESLGLTENKAFIQKYEEEQEKKAIISYEQLLKNASNISISYQEEKRLSDDAPVVNKLEVLEREIVPVQSYLEEDEFLRILKEFRAVLE